MYNSLFYIVHVLSQRDVQNKKIFKIGKMS